MFSLLTTMKTKMFNNEKIMVCLMITKRKVENVRKLE